MRLFSTGREMLAGVIGGICELPCIGSARCFCTKQVTKHITYHLQRQSVGFGTLLREPSHFLTLVNVDRHTKQGYLADHQHCSTFDY